MIYRLLLVDARGNAVCTPLRIRQLREFPGPAGLSVHFRPVRNDLLFHSARAGGQIAYRILQGEGVVRAHVSVEFEVPDATLSVVGRSSDLLFALTLVTSKWHGDKTLEVAVAATGALNADGSVDSVEHTVGKVAAAVQSFAATGAEISRAYIFYPSAEAAAVDAWRGANGVPSNIELRAVAHLDDALTALGYTLEKVYLRNPFRGLEHFDFADHAIFFGREAEVRDVAQLLLRRESAGFSGLLVEGASGSGKSSFLRAGVLPALVQPRFLSAQIRASLSARPVSSGVARAIWRPGTLTPEANEVQIADSLARSWASFPELETRLLESPLRGLDDLLGRRRSLWPESTRFVWLIDQFEELLMRGLSGALIDAFGRFLRTLQGEGVWTLASIRADATPLFKSHAALREVFGTNEGQYYLETLGGTALDSVITRPAHAADLQFEGDTQGRSLDRLLLEDAYREKDSLPMLQFTLNELYQRRDGNLLTLAAYRELGGLAGSIATTAQRVLNVDGDEAPRIARRVFRSLVSVDDTGDATRRYAPMAEAQGDEAQQRLLLRFIQARLCVTDQRAGQAVVAFAHDTLLRTLPALTDWLKEEAGLLQTRELAQREAQAWYQHEHSDDWLASPDKLLAYKTLEDAEVVLPPPLPEFLTRSRGRVRRLRRLRRIAIGSISVLALGVVAGAVAFALQARKAEEAQQMTARRGEFLEGLLKSADPRGGSKDVTVAQLLDQSSKQIESFASNEPLVAASMLSLVAETNEGLSRLPEGLAANTRAVGLLQAHGGSAADMSAALSTRGELLMLQGRYHDAYAPLNDAVALVEAQPGAQKQLAVALDDLGDAYQESREKEAEVMYKRAIDVYLRAAPALAAAPAAADPFANLGVLYVNEGRLTEAVDYLRRAVDMRRTSLPPDHPDLLDAEFNYASALEKTNRAKAAEPIFRKLLATYTRVEGARNVNTLVAAQGIAHNLLIQQRYEEAMTTALPVAQALSELVGEGHQWSQTTWGVYGVAACLAGHGEEGLAALRRVAVLRRTGDDTPEWRKHITDIQIGTCLVAQKKYQEAEPLLLATVSGLEAERGTTYETTRDGYRALRDLYAQIGRADESARWQGKLAQNVP